MDNTFRVNDKVRFSHHHVLQAVTFAARIVKIDGAFAWVEMPPRVRRLPFPPIGGKRYGKYEMSKLVRA